VSQTGDRGARRAASPPNDPRDHDVSRPQRPPSSPLRSARRTALVLVAALVALGLVPSTAGATGAGDRIWAVTASGQLVAFDPSTPGTLATSIAITGLASGETVLGADVRPATGQLVVLGSTNRLYTVDPTTGAATAIGAAFTPAVTGTAVGFDFNPTVDRIRLVTDAEQDLRLNPITGAVAATDTALAYAPGDPNAGASPDVAAAAYTNSLGGATSTTLYDIDVAGDRLVRQDPPNGGALNTVGPLGVDATEASFDIAGDDGSAWAALRVGGSTGLYRVDLATGAATLVGAIGAGDAVVGLAVPQAVPAGPVTAWALTVDGRIARLGGATAGAVVSSMPVTGLAAGETLLGIDERPASGQLYGVGSTGRVYVVEPLSGVATAVAGPFSPLPSGTAFGIDFNPTVDRIRLVSESNQNLRLHPDTGAAVATDGALAYAPGDVNAGDDPDIVAAAYTSNRDLATSTTLYVIDRTEGVLAIQNPPNAGVLNTVGPLGVDGTITEAGFDIGPDGTAVATLTVGGTSRLYRVDLATGAATLLGITGTPVADVALPVDATTGLGYTLAARDGGTFSFGDATNRGGLSGTTLNGPVVGIAPRPAGQGYWLVARDGGVFAFGDATSFGSAVGTATSPVVGIAAHPNGRGYWVVTDRGQVLPFGSATALGDASGTVLQAPIVGMAATTTGRGYWLFAADGGVFAFGDAPFYGSAGALTLNRPVVGGGVSADGRGYYLVASDGGVFTYGPGARFSGSTGAITLVRPVVGITVDPDGLGYWLVASDGGVFAFDAPFLGSTGAITLNAPVVGIAHR
jgi:hypothetical protein